MIEGKVEKTVFSLKGKVKSLDVPPIDKTLTKEGQTADAKATGDAIKEVDAELKEIVNSEIVGVRKEITNLDSELATERARIDQFTKLEEGSTSGDAELADARVDKNGKTHVNVGTHIRKVTSQLSGEIADAMQSVVELRGMELENKISPDILTDNYYVAFYNGADLYNEEYKATEFISVTPNDTFVATFGVGQFAYYNNGNYVSGYAKSEFETTKHTVPEGVNQVRFSVYKPAYNTIKGHGVFFCSFEEYDYLTNLYNKQLREDLDNCKVVNILVTGSKIYEHKLTLDEYTETGLLTPNGRLATEYADYVTTPYLSTDNIKRIYGKSFPNEVFSCFCIYDDRKNFIASYTGVYDIDIATLSNARYFRASVHHTLDDYYCCTSPLSEYTKGLIEKVATLEDALKFLENEIAELKGNVSYYGDFNYLAIGNSITWHNKCDYWWNECGMAASTADNDYYHRVVQHLSDKKGVVSSYVMNFATWELQSYDRAETLSMLDKYLSTSLNLITIQLSENANDLTSFESDYNEMIAYIKAKAPNAQIIIVDDFWDAYKSTSKHNIANENNVDFADLSGVRGDDKYKCGLDTIVYGDNGAEHTVTHGGVANHPGDLGMEYIANQIIKLIN